MHNRYAAVVRADDGDRLRPVTGPVINPTVRRALTRVSGLAGATAVLVVSSAVLAGPASAKVAEGWGEQEPVDKMHVLGVLVGIPILLFLIIVAAVYLPSLVRGERVAPGATGPQDQWLGGRRDAGALEAAGPGTPSTQSDADAVGGGASARW